MRLLAISDLHLSHRTNREALFELGDFPEDWLIVAGDVGESPEHLVLALRELTPRFRKVIWTPGNHELWSPRHATDRTRGVARYDELIAVCRDFGAISPEDPYPQFPAEPDTYVVPMFLLYDYSFRPADVPLTEAVAWARQTGVVCGDEFMLDAQPFVSRIAWCEARVAATEARLDALPEQARTVLVNHWPLRADLARPPRIPRFSIWCGTTATEGWARRYRARAVVSGHLHLRTTLWRHGVRYDEVSLGYPRDWRHERGLAYYLREILPGTSADAQRFTPPRDPFFYGPPTL
jgi:3',5'-cyclic AMP phosphodiesterase CpdA